MSYRNQPELEEIMTTEEKTLRKQLQEVTAERDTLRQRVTELQAALNVSTQRRPSPFVTIGDEGSSAETSYERGNPDWV